MLRNAFLRHYPICFVTIGDFLQMPQFSSSFFLVQTQVVVLGIDFLSLRQFFKYFALTTTSSLILVYVVEFVTPSLIFGQLQELSQKIA